MLLRDELDNYHLTCLICWDKEEIIVPEYPGQAGLLALQEHFIEMHELTHSEFDEASRTELRAYRYTTPSGRPFLLAVERQIHFQPPLTDKLKRPFSI